MSTQELKCPRCKNITLENQKFCPSCGFDLKFENSGAPMYFDEHYTCGYHHGCHSRPRNHSC